MAKLGRKRMAHLKGRFEYVLCDFSKRGWNRKIKGPFEAVVSSIAIHNVRSSDIIRAIYSETFALVKTGGCFLNFDRMTPSLKDQMKWLREAGFENVKCFWEGGRRALVGGSKKQSVNDRTCFSGLAAADSIRCPLPQITSLGELGAPGGLAR